MLAVIAGISRTRSASEKPLSGRTERSDASITAIGRLFQFAQGRFVKGLTSPVLSGAPISTSPFMESRLSDPAFLFPNQPRKYPAARMTRTNTTARITFDFVSIAFILPSILFFLQIIFDKRDKRKFLSVPSFPFE